MSVFHPVRVGDTIFRYVRLDLTERARPGVNNELQYYTNNNNARHDGNGNLVLQARREVTPGSAWCSSDR